MLCHCRSSGKQVFSGCNLFQHVSNLRALTAQGYHVNSILNLMSLIIQSGQAQFVTFLMIRQFTLQQIFGKLIVGFNINICLKFQSEFWDDVYINFFSSLVRSTTRTRGAQRCQVMDYIMLNVYGCAPGLHLLGAAYVTR